MTQPSASYYPPPESEGGWRWLRSKDDVREIGGMDPDPSLSRLDELDGLGRHEHQK